MLANLLAVSVEVTLEGLYSGVAELLTERRVGEWRIQVPVDERRGPALCDDVAFERSLVDFRERVVQPFAVPERLMDGSIEAVEEPQLELVRAHEQVLQLREGERDPRGRMHGLRRQPGLRDRRGRRRHPLLCGDVIEELRAGSLLLVVRQWRVGNVEYFWARVTATYRGGSRPRAFRDSGLGRRGIVRDYVPQCIPPITRDGNRFLRIAGRTLPATAAPSTGAPSRLSRRPGWRSPRRCQRRRNSRAPGARATWRTVVLRLGLGRKVDLLVVRDDLAELPELVEDELGAARVSR